MLFWAERQGFTAVVAKATPAARSVMVFMGGQPVSAYRERGFEVMSHWIDEQLRDVVLEQGLVEAGAGHEDASQVSCCVKLFGGGRSHT